MITLIKIGLRLLLSVVILAFAFSFAYNRWIDPNVTGNARELVTSGEYASVDEVDMHFEKQGSGFETLIFLHGNGSSMYTWREVIGDLATTYSVYAIDVPGWGYSSRGPNINYRTEAQVERLASFFEQQGISQATIVGHDTGSNIALAFAEDYPELTNRLVLISPMTYRKSFPVPQFFLKIPEISQTIIKLSHTDSRLENVYRDMFVDESGITSADIQAYIQPYQIQETENSLVSMYSQKDTVQYDVTNSDSPALIIYGEKDRIVPRVDIDRLAADMFQAEAVYIENTGHIPQEEQPSIVTDEIRNFLNNPIL